MRSETSLIKEELRTLCQGLGVDLGCGGDKITPWTIGFDMQQPYTKVGDDIIEMRGDAQVLPFNDNVLDYVFSSHLLEDFPNTKEILDEWIRVIKPGGMLMLYLPNEKRYREHCKLTGQDYNQSHQVEEMSLDYIKKILMNYNGVMVKENASHGDYSFLCVWQKGEAKA